MVSGSSNDANGPSKINDPGAAYHRRIATKAAFRNDWRPCRKPDAAQGQLVQCLVFGALGLALGQRAVEAFARRGQEHDVRPLMSCRGVDVRRGRLAPALWRLAAMESAILLAIEQVEHRAGHTGKAPEVTYGGGIDVHAANAAEFGHHVADPRAAGVEALGTASKPGKQVEVTDFTAVGEGTNLHRGVSRVLLNPSPADASDWPGQGRAQRGRSPRPCGGRSGVSALHLPLCSPMSPFPQNLRNLHCLYSCDQLIERHTAQFGQLKHDVACRLPNRQHGS